MPTRRPASEIVPPAAGPRGSRVGRAVHLALGPVVCLALLGSAVFVTACSKSDQAQDTSASSTTALAPNLLGAVKDGPPDGPPTDGGKISYGIDAEPEGLDPTRYAFSQAGHAVASAVFDTLATLDENGRVVPYLATGFDHDDTSMSWTIGLPTGVTFHDGTPLDADAVVIALQAYRESAITGTSFKAMVRDIQKVDATHVRVDLVQRFQNFPIVFTTQLGYIPAPSMITNPDLVKKPIGSGPFIFQDHVDGKIWSFKKNPDYRIKGLPHLASIDFKPIDDPADRNRQLQSGDLDVIQTYGGPQILELRTTTYKRVENQHGDKAFLVMNTTAPPFDNLTARKAIAYATDSARWRKEILADVALPANSPYGPGQPGYLKDNGFPAYNIDTAKQLVQQYTTETGKPLEFTFLAVSDQTNASVANLFKATFEQAGMKVTVQQLPQINLLASVAVGSYQLSQFRLFGSPDPDADIWFYRSSSIVTGVSLNFPRYANPDIDAAVDAAIGTDDQAKRASSYESISKILGEQVPFVWLGQETWMVAANPSVNGIYGAMNGSLPTIGPKTWIATLSVTR